MDTLKPEKFFWVLDGPSGEVFFVFVVGGVRYEVNTHCRDVASAQAATRAMLLTMADA